MSHDIDDHNDKCGECGNWFPHGHPHFGACDAKPDGATRVADDPNDVEDSDAFDLPDLPFIGFRAIPHGGKAPAVFSNSTGAAQIYVYNGADEQKLTVRPWGHEAIRIECECDAALRIVHEKETGALIISPESE